MRYSFNYIQVKKAGFKLTICLVSLKEILRESSRLLGSWLGPSVYLITVSRALLHELALV